MNKLRPVERAYIAGFFDGEGCVSLRPKNRQGMKSPWLSMTQKDPKVLYKIQKTMGCGTINPCYRDGKIEAWRLWIYPVADVYAFILATRKYCVVKRPKLVEAKRIIEGRSWLT